MELASPQPGLPAARIERWPTEWPLRILIAVISLGIWVVLCISIIGIVYAVAIGVFLAIAHLALIAHVRGSAVRLRPEQFPDLHRRVQEIGARAGLKREPEAYLMQAGGALNAFAARFLRSDLLVLYTDLLDACEGDEAARDMVIAHEVGHIRCGHLRWRWLLFPGLFVPILGSAYSRACEYTCDRYGAALCGDRRGALRGLAILAAGGRHGREVRLEPLVAQRRALDTGLMTLGTWLATHPPLAERIAALDPDLGSASAPSGVGALKAIGILSLALAIPAAGGAFAAAELAKKLSEEMHRAGAAPASRPQRMQPLPANEIPLARVQVTKDFQELARIAEAFHDGHRRFPTDAQGLYNAWRSGGGKGRFPRDPFDGEWYGYGQDGRRFWLWSSGPDMQTDTEDDIEYGSPEPEAGRPAGAR